MCSDYFALRLLPMNHPPSLKHIHTHILTCICIHILVLFSSDKVSLGSLNLKHSWLEYPCPPLYMLKLNDYTMALGVRTLGGDELLTTDLLWKGSSPRKVPENCLDSSPRTKTWWSQSYKKQSPTLRPPRLLYHATAAPKGQEFLSINDRWSGNSLVSIDW